MSYREFARIYLPEILKEHPVRQTLLAAATAVSLASFIPAQPGRQRTSLSHNAAEIGHKLALFVCSTCHEVDPNQEFLPALINPAPSFATIAHDVKSTRISLRKFLDTPHGDFSKLPMQMPDMMLTDQRTLPFAYIMSLRNAP
jgi:mono/diheme cytochrome c family protein